MHFCPWKWNHKLKCRIIELVSNGHDTRLIYFTIKISFFAIPTLHMSYISESLEFQTQFSSVAFTFRRYRDI